MLYLPYLARIVLILCLKDKLQSWRNYRGSLTKKKGANEGNNLSNRRALQWDFDLIINDLGLVYLLESIGYRINELVRHQHKGNNEAVGCWWPVLVRAQWAGRFCCFFSFVQRVHNSLYSPLPAHMPYMWCTPCSQRLQTNQWLYCKGQVY